MLVETLVNMIGLNINPVKQGSIIFEADMVLGQDAFAIYNCWALTDNGIVSSLNQFPVENGFDKTFPNTWSTASLNNQLRILTNGLFEL